MYVCLCQAVRDAEVRQAVAAGVADLDRLAEQLGIGTGCGGCREFAQSLIDEYAEAAPPHCAAGSSVDGPEPRIALPAP